MRVTAAAARQEIDRRVNYPLHLHSLYPTDKKPAALRELVCCRYDTFFDNPGWPEAIQMDEPLRSLIEGYADRLG